jgi:hypothetical protein
MAAVDQGIDTIIYQKGKVSAFISIKLPTIIVPHPGRFEPSGDWYYREHNKYVY